MSVREAINGNKAMGIVAAVVLAAAAIGVSLFYNRQPADALSTGDEAFYTIDDGKTWFVDDANKIPPFEHNGKTAYRCYLFTTDGGKTAFVSHLERFTPEGRKLAESGGVKANPTVVMRRLSTGGGVEIKRPLTGDVGWIPQGDPSASTIMRPQSPDGSPLPNLEPVWPSK
jgi:hypothetical protein